MNKPVRIGATARTMGPLKPSGRVSVDGRSLEATSEGMWIDGDTLVVIVGGDTQRVVVRVASADSESLPASGELLAERREPETTPLQAPPAWVERINAVACGAMLGAVLVPLVWLLGTPISVYAALVPLGGAVAGQLFQWFVGNAVHSVGPREDHRAQARVTAMIVVTSALLGAGIGVSSELTFLGMCLGLPVGAFVGGMLVSVGWILSNFI